MIKIKVLGSGTSTGVPLIGCKCSVCTSKNEKDQRLRTSILIQTNGVNILIDTTPDLRQQALKNEIEKIDAVIYTHHHFDHIGGFDDLRAFNFIQKKPVQIYLKQETLDNLKIFFQYAFSTEVKESSSPVVKYDIINLNKFRINDVEIEPIELQHGKMEVYGYRFGGFAYCTDCNYINETSLDKLRNLECLIIDGLRYEKHLTHFTIDEAVEIINILKPKKAYLTHISHDVMHTKANIKLPKNIELAYDGLEIIIK